MGCIYSQLCKNAENDQVFTYSGTSPVNSHRTPYKKLYNRTFVGRNDTTGSIYIIPFNGS
jgi:hypothetical protein